MSRKHTYGRLKSPDQLANFITTRFEKFENKSRRGILYKKAMESKVLLAHELSYCTKKSLLILKMINK